jgi:hypothetical protein
VCEPDEKQQDGETATIRPSDGQLSEKFITNNTEDGKHDSGEDTISEGDSEDEESKEESMQVELERRTLLSKRIAEQ